MTNPTANPGIHQLPEPCWTVLKSDGEGTGPDGAEYHFPNRAEAEKEANTYTGQTVIVTAVPGGDLRCWTATLLCGEPFEYEGDVVERHFVDRANLEHAAGLTGCLLTEDDVLTCGDDAGCETCDPQRRALKQKFSIRDTHPDVFTIGVLAGWADRETDPTEIDWVARRAESLMGIPLVDGRPVNRWGRNLPYGRGALGHWGERVNADAIVTAIVGRRRYILLGERDDGNGWAIPGGGRKAGEDAIDNALRELFEETGLRIDRVKRAHQITEHGPRYVQDPRTTREAWQVTVPVVVDLGQVDQLPTVKGSDDLVRTEWFPCDTVYRVTDRISELGGKLFEAHRQMLNNAIYGQL